MEEMPGMTLEEWTEFLHLKPGDKVKHYVRKEGASGYVNCTVVAPYKGWALLERNGRRFGAMLTDIRRKEWGRKA